MTYKPVYTYSPVEHKVRLFRLIWDRGRVGYGGVSHCLSIGLVPQWIGWRHTDQDWRLTLCGMVVRFARSHGGRFV